MKIFISNEDWADEGDVFFCSIESEERLKKLRDLIDLYVELDLLPSPTAMYWELMNSLTLLQKILNNLLIMQKIFLQKNALF